MMDDKWAFPGRVGLQQRVLPSYRVPFFDHLDKICQRGVSIFAGQPRKDEGIQVVESLEEATFTPAKNIHILRGGYYLCYQRGLHDWLEEQDPDVLILEANPRYISNRKALRWMHHRNRPVVGWGLGVTRTQGLFSKFRQRIKKRYLNEFDALISYSTAGAEQYAELGFPPERIHVALNSATLPPTKQPDRLLKIAPAVRVLFVGRLQARKRVDLLLRVCSLVEPRPECWIVGDGPERSALEKLARDVFPSTKFFGSKHGQELSDLFNEADLFVLPGTGGLAIQEAMAHGLPVIVAEGDGTQRDLVSKDNGWLINPGSLEELSNAMRDAISDPEKLLRMGDVSYQIVIDRANIDAMAGVFTNVMNSISEGRS